MEVGRRRIGRTDPVGGDWVVVGFSGIGGRRRKRPFGRSHHGGLEGKKGRRGGVRSDSLYMSQDQSTSHKQRRLSVMVMRKVF